MSSHTLVGGQVLTNVHAAGTCYGEFCPIHKFSDHPMVEWDQTFLGGMMFRVSPDGYLFPDPDSPRTVERPNAIRCNSCGDEIVSIHRHDYVTCNCGGVSADGGNEYHKRAWKEGHSWTEIEAWPIRKDLVEA